MSTRPRLSVIVPFYNEEENIERMHGAIVAALEPLEVPFEMLLVNDGSRDNTLQLAIGHIGGTALPGEPGNIGLAAHRDTFFRRLGEIQANDQIRLVTREGTFTYRVQGTQIVEPRDTWVLRPTDVSSVTLVTCYPFRYVGSAPQRFIVRAELARG